MKISTLLLSLICCFSFFQINAQFSVGVRGGGIKAWEDYGDVEVPPNAQTHVFGFQASAIAYFDISKHFSIGLEPGYAQRGAACVPEFITFQGDSKLLFNYFELPLMLSIKFPVLKEKFEVKGKAGYGVSKITTAFQEWENTEGEIERDKLDFNNPFGINVNRWDNGMYGGLGFAYNIGDNQFILESTYYLGLKDADANATSKNRSIHLGMGYLIRL